MVTTLPELRGERVRVGIRMAARYRVWREACRSLAELALAGHRPGILEAAVVHVAESLEEYEAAEAEAKGLDQAILDLEEVEDNG